MELGPDSILVDKPAGKALLQELGLEDGLVDMLPQFKGARIVSNGMPQSKSVSLSASRTTAITVNVTNTGAVTQQYFADPRLTALGTVALPAVKSPTCAVSTALPGTCAQFILPPETSTIQFTAGT